jgi:hypothetical protein
VIGLFCLFPTNAVCWDLHVVMYPWATTAEKWQAARELIPWLAKHTACKRITGAIPEPKRQAMIYATHGLGMRYAGRQPKAIMLDGRLRDLVLYGRPVEVNGAKSRDVGDFGNPGGQQRA